jgi:hypothetical protein
MSLTNQSMADASSSNLAELLQHLSIVCQEFLFRIGGEIGRIEGRKRNYGE